MRGMWWASGSLFWEGAVDGLLNRAFFDRPRDVEDGKRWEWGMVCEEFCKTYLHYYYLIHSNHLWVPRIYPPNYRQKSTTTVLKTIPVSHHNQPPSTSSSTAPTPPSRHRHYSPPLLALHSPSRSIPTPKLHLPPLHSTSFSSLPPVSQQDMEVAGKMGWVPHFIDGGRGSWWWLVDFRTIGCVQWKGGMDGGREGALLRWQSPAVQLLLSRDIYIYMLVNESNRAFVSRGFLSPWLLMMYMNYT